MRVGEALVVYADSTTSEVEFTKKILPVVVSHYDAFDAKAVLNLVSKGYFPLLSNKNKTGWIRSKN